MEHGEHKIGKVMGEFKRGKLHSGSGQMVKDRKQAVAIAMSEAEMTKKKHGMSIKNEVMKRGKL